MLLDKPWTNFYRNRYNLLYTEIHFLLSVSHTEVRTDHPHQIVPFWGVLILYSYNYCTKCSFRHTVIFPFMHKSLRRILPCVGAVFVAAANRTSPSLCHPLTVARIYHNGELRFFCMVIVLHFISCVDGGQQSFPCPFLVFSFYTSSIHRFWSLCIRQIALSSICGVFFLTPAV